MKKIKCAVIGVGNMGRNHARVYSEIPGVELVALADTNPAVVDESAKRFNSMGYVNYKQMLDAEKPLVVSVCVPTVLHHEVAKECLNRGINVLLEKPITMDLKAAEDLLKAAEATGAKFLVGHIERFNPAVLKIKNMVDKGELGNIINIIARRVGGFPPQIKDADIAVDLAIHDIDIVNYLLERLPVEVYVNRQRNHIVRRDDSVEFFLKYNNASAFVQANWITPVKIRKLSITGSEGYLEMDYISQQISFFKSNYDKFKETKGDFSDYILHFSEPDVMNITVATKEPLKEEILYFIDCVTNNKKCDSRFAIEALKTALS
ncbi:MAG: Gfo/Idh/MocA family oxidoreductase [Patescibacteria group bacterium]|nr:Gfo/Idh/MocA family oxidoreductase [Patescibacteria group bacterium]MCL5224319.1 Gfo/Idh/MocA family oxidoreductase [Patescibacteria group bacterium]